MKKAALTRKTEWPFLDAADLYIVESDERNPPNRRAPVTLGDCDGLRKAQT
jgi:hypothetical protein